MNTIRNPAQNAQPNALNRRMVTNRTSKFFCFFSFLSLFIVGVSPAQEAITIDVGSPHVVLEGAWKVEKRDWVEGAAMVAERNQNQQEPKSITFNPPISRAGEYVLWIAMPPFGYSTRMRLNDFIVEHADGVFKTSIDISIGGSAWAPVGVFRFEPGKPALVRFEDLGGNRASAFSAIRLTPATPSGFNPNPLPNMDQATDDFERAIIHNMRILSLAELDHGNDPTMKASLDRWVMEAAIAYYSMNRSPDRDLLWGTRAQPPGNRAGFFADHIARILAAYYSPHTPDALGIRGNPQVIKDMKEALSWITETLYNEKLVWNGAYWWGQEIGAPRAINDCLLLLYPHIDRTYIDQQLRGSFTHMPDPRRYYKGGGESTGANRVWLAMVALRRGFLTKNEEEVRLGRDTALDTVVYSDQGLGDGFFKDGTFIQHGGIVYNWGYANSLYTTFVEMFDAVSGSRWAYSTEELRVLSEFYLNGMAPFVNFANLFPGTIGRAFGRQQNEPPQASTLPGVAGSIYAIAPPNMKSAILSSIAGSYADLQALGIADQFRRNSPREHARVMDILRSLPTVPVNKPEFSRIYHHGDRLLHRRSDFVFGVSMTSRRIADYESIWGNNHNGWYQGHGHHWLLDQGDPLKYAEQYRATVDPYRLAGVTLDKRERMLGAAAGGNEGSTNTRDWVGGVQLGGMHSAAGMEIGVVPAGDELTGRKSWFAFDREIVAMGSGITGTSVHAVETIVENARVTSIDAVVTVNGAAAELPPGQATPLSNARTLHIAGNNKSDGLGIVFFETEGIIALRELRTGSWADAQLKADPTEHVRPFVTVYYNHGVKPTNAKYAYVLLPASDANRTNAFGAANPVSIVAHSETVHAAMHQTLGLLGANFFQAGVAGPLQADQPCSVMTRVAADRIDMAMSDPTQKNSGPITVKLAMNVSAQLEADPGIEIVSTSPLTLRFQPSGAQGKTFSASFRR